jgi:parallel beta-helix repeat protein
MRRVGWRMAIVGGVLAAAVPTSAGGARAAAVACGDTVSESVVLTADLECMGPGLRIASQGISVDLNGHTISGSGVGTGIAVRSASASVTVKNGTIRGFGAGVDVIGNGVGSPVTDVSLQHLLLTSNVIGVSTNFVGVFRIEDSVIRHNAFDGIALLETDNVWVRRNKVMDNGGAGIEAIYSVDRALYENNRVNRNAGDGILVQRSTSTIIGNTANANGGDGIRVIEGDPGLFFRYLVSHNRADRNANYGIAQMAGMPDPKSNTANHNGNPEQCLNITCTPR